MNCLSRYDQEKGCFVLKHLTPPKPANAFEWKRFVLEEDARREAGIGIVPTVRVSSRRQTVNLAPRIFTIYNRA